ncbi:MAG TPA: hypothetical protein VG870_00260 [Chitinophagaceae bacterium]|nr:hypothetical protein [Chitinophagaceae bacterium]
MQLVQNDPCDHVELDFSSVDYISRSFADQFHIDKITCTVNQQKTIIVSNASDEIINMLQAVAKSKHIGNGRAEKVPVFKYSSYSQLEEFFLSF